MRVIKLRKCLLVFFGILTSLYLAMICIRVIVSISVSRKTICPAGRQDCIRPRGDYGRMESREVDKKAIPPAIIQPQGRPGRKAFLCFAYNGRLGNHMFQFASVYGIAKVKGMMPAIPEHNPLLNIFKLDIPVIPPKMCGSFYEFHEKRPCAFDPESVNFPNTIDIMLSGSYQSWRYFEHVSQQLKQQFIFRDEIVRKAQLVLSRSVSEKVGSVGSTETTLIGMHIRRGDMLQWDSVDAGYQVATTEYFLNAMNLFRGRYRRVLFIVCSNDMDWARFRLSQTDVVFMPKQEPEVDMATLALCSHSVMSVGSFGWWGAWLARGTTTYYAHQYRKGTRISSIFNMSDYVYPHWIALE